MNMESECRRCKGTGRRMTMGGMRRCPCTPAPPKVRGPNAATHEGECGFCELRFTVRTKNNTLALHGYQRPGNGWIVGDCPGHGNLPVELSPITLEMLREHATRWLVNAKAALAYFESGNVTELHTVVRKEDAPPFSRGAEYNEDVVVKKGDGPNTRRGIPSFDSLLRFHVEKARQDASRAGSLLERAVERIANWSKKDLRPL